MNVIHKFAIPVLEKFTLDLPDTAHIIRIDDVDGKFWMWVVVDTEAKYVKRYFEVYKTGQEIKTPISHLFYHGFFKMFIMQELCLYLFENHIKTIDTE